MPNNRVIAEIEFLDHCSHEQGVGGILPCVAVGFLVSEDEKQIVICPWMAGGNFNDENSETLAIVKHPGIKVRMYHAKNCGTERKRSKNSRAKCGNNRSSRRGPTKVRKTKR